VGKVGLAFGSTDERGEGEKGETFCRQWGKALSKEKSRKGRAPRKLRNRTRGKWKKSTLGKPKQKIEHPSCQEKKSEGKATGINKKKPGKRKRTQLTTTNEGGGVKRGERRRGVFVGKRGGAFLRSQISKIKGKKAILGGKTGRVLSWKLDHAMPGRPVSAWKMEGKKKGGAVKKAFLKISERKVSLLTLNRKKGEKRLLLTAKKGKELRVGKRNSVAMGRENGVIALTGPRGRGTRDLNRGEHWCPHHRPPKKRGERKENPGKKRYFSGKKKGRMYGRLTPLGRGKKLETLPRKGGGGGGSLRKGGLQGVRPFKKKKRPTGCKGTRSGDR